MAITIFKIAGIILGIPIFCIFIYVLFILCSISIDGILFYLERYTNNKYYPSNRIRVVLAIPSVLLFPFIISFEMFFSFFSHIGRIPFKLLSKEPSLIYYNIISFFSGILFPIWLIPVLLWKILYFYRTVFIFFRENIFIKPFINAKGGRKRHTIFETFVGLRYLKSQKQQKFISAISSFSIIGVAVGVCALIVVLSVMSGFEEDLKKKILGTNSHAIVLNYNGNIDNQLEIIDKLKSQKDIIGITPFIYNEVMITGPNSGSGAVIKGIDPKTVGSVTDLINSLEIGLSGELKTIEEKKKAIFELNTLYVDADVEIPKLIVGKEFAKTMHISVSDIVTVISPLGDVGPMGVRSPKFQRFLVAGIFHSGMYEYDAKFTYTSIPAAQKFFSMIENISGLELKIKDIYSAKKVANDVEKLLGYPYWCQDWMSMNKNLFSALSLEKVVMAIILGMIIIVAALNIISTLIMGVIEKTRDISILKTMGATSIQIMKIFMTEGLIIGFIGTTLGLLSGFAICYFLKRTKFISLNPDVYYLDSLPVQISFSMFVFVAFSALMISFTATLYPSWYASKQMPVEGLRYE